MRVFGARATRQTALFFLGLLLVYPAYLLVRHEPLPQLAIRFLPEIQKPASGETILVFAPHADDETIGAGAYIAAARAAGASVYVAFASDGAALAPKETRTSEALSAMQILGVNADHLLFFSFPDGFVAQHRPELQRRVREALEQLRPAVVFVTDPADGHPDHSTLGREVVQAWRQNRGRFRLYTYLIHFHGYSMRIGSNKFLVPPAPLSLRRWVRFSPRPDDLEKEKRALYIYQSQLKREPKAILLSFLDKKNEIFVSASPSLHADETLAHTVPPSGHISPYYEGMKALLEKCKPILRIK